jgi:hypothetical protein
VDVIPIPEQNSSFRRRCRTKTAGPSGAGCFCINFQVLFRSDPESAEQAENEASVQQAHAFSNLSTGAEVHVKLRDVASRFTNGLQKTSLTLNGLLVRVGLLLSRGVVSRLRRRVTVFEMEEEEVTGGSILTSRQDEPRTQGEQHS